MSRIASQRLVRLAVLIECKHLVRLSFVFLRGIMRAQALNPYPLPWMRVFFSLCGDGLFVFLQPCIDVRFAIDDEFGLDEFRSFSVIAKLGRNASGHARNICAESGDI